VEHGPQAGAVVAAATDRVVEARAEGVDEAGELRVPPRRRLFERDGEVVDATIPSPFSAARH
jgi:hypothetical protein